MSAPNGHAGSSSSPAVNASKDIQSLITNGAASLGADRIAKIIADLEVPFDPSVIEWRVMNAARDKGRGQVIPYADQRAYTDRLNALFMPSGWTRKYAVNTSANFQRGTDQKTVAKVIVTCELTIFGLGSHSATGEEWADNKNAATAAEAQAFKRSCACFGLGRYLYYFEGIWVDLDDRKRPKNVPQLPPWATPDGWRSGVRPLSDCRGGAPNSKSGKTAHSQQTRPPDQKTNSALVREIEAMAEPLGKAIYRGLMRTVARVWKPAQIQDTALLEKVLRHMQAAQRGLHRLDAALDITGPEALGSVLQSLRITSLDKVDTLETLKKIVLEMERIAAKGTP